MRYLLLLTVLVLSSCTTYYYYSPSQYTSTTNSNDASQLTNIPFYAHNNEIDVFFGNEKPKKKYIKAALLEEIAYGEISYAALVQQLKEQAQQRGVDALIILSRDRNVSETEFSVITTNIVNALGIKYVENLKFEEGIPKQATLSIFDDEKAEFIPKQILDVDKFGQVQLPSPMSSSLYQYNFYNYSLDFMLYEVNRNWFYSPNLQNPSQIYKRKYKTIDRTFTFTYDAAGNVSHVLRITPSTKIEFEFEYENGLLVRQKTYRKVNAFMNISSKSSKQSRKKDTKGTEEIKEKIPQPTNGRLHERTEIYEYLPNGARLRRTIFKIKDGKPQPYMKLSFEYYTKEEYEGLIRKAQQTTL